jgi:predicted transcriptional regulator
MKANLDPDFLGMIEVIIQGPNRQALRKFVEFLYEQEEELLSEADWAAIREGQEDARQGRVISLEEYEKARGL